MIKFIIFFVLLQYSLAFQQFPRPKILGLRQSSIVPSQQTFHLSQLPASVTVNNQAEPSKNVIDLRSTLRNYYRSSWFTWWAQIILSVVSGAIITFANVVRQINTKDYSIWLSGFALSGVGVFLALLSSLWTWNATTLCRRIWSKKVDNAKIVPSLRRSAKTAVGISLVGMLVTLIAAEQIVGTLFSKILASQAFNGLLFNAQAVNSLTNAFQPIDIFLVQANTNCLVSHFVSLFSYTILQLQLPKDDQPVQLLTERRVHDDIEEI